MRKLLSTVTGISLAALVALVVLQWIPYTGIFLMIIAGPLIAGLLVHVVLASMLVEALLGRLPRVLAAVPLVAYAGYALLYAQQTAAIAAKAAELKAANPGQVLAFDPQAHALVSGSHAQALVSTYRIPVAYEPNRNYAPEDHLSYRLLPRDQCQIPRDTQSRVYVFWVQVGAKSARAPCVLRFPDRPAGRIVTVTRNEPKARDAGEIAETAIRVESEGAVLGTFRTARVQRLPVFPWLAIGCGLNSGAPSWDCFAGFWRSQQEIDALPPGAPAGHLPEALMLGLHKYTPDERAAFRGFPENDAAVARAGQEAERVTDTVFATLGAIVAGGEPELPHNMSYSIAREPERLAPLAEPMAQRLVELQAAPGRPNQKRIEMLRVLAAGLAALPAESFAKVAGTAFAAVRAGDLAREHPTLYLRAADYGTAALPFYRAELMRQHRGLTRALPALALCRIGQADAETIDEMKTRILGPEAAKDRRYQTALFVALARFGEAEFLRANLAALNEKQHDWMETVLAGDGDVDGRPNNCMSHEWGQTGHLGEALQKALHRLRGRWSKRPGIG
jgi:hypothetical protein